MNKSKSAFRKCGFCSHLNQQPKCCCQRKNQSTQKVKKAKSKPNPLVNESSIRYMDDSQLKFQQTNFSNLIAQNSMLKCQNHNLRNDLLSLSHCINQEKNPYNKQYSSVTTSNTLKTESEQILSDRLYISNKNLQQAILQIDNLSKKYKDLSDKNLSLRSNIQTLNFENEELKQDVTILKKQLKRYQQSINDSDKNALKQNYKNLRQKYENLKIQTANLNDEISKLKIELSKKHSIASQNMSPEWIAQTSNKLSFIQQKIDCTENRFKNQEPQKPQKPQKSQINHNSYDSVQNNSNYSYFEMLHQIKTQIALAINTIHSKTRKFNSVFDTIGNVQNINAKSLICTLIEGFVECCINLNLTIERQVNRRINVLEKRMQNLLGKLQNFVLEIKNRQLRNRSTSRSRILVKNKSALSTKSPYAYQSNKENINSLNSIDKSY